MRAILPKEIAGTPVQLYAIESPSREDISTRYEHLNTICRLHGKIISDVDLLYAATTKDTKGATHTSTFSLLAAQYVFPSLMEDAQELVLSEKRGYGDLELSVDTMRSIGSVRYHPYDTEKVIGQIIIQYEALKDHHRLIITDILGNSILPGDIHKAIEDISKNTWKSLLN